MGIHHTYKSQAGERALKKHSKQLERQRRSQNRKILKQQKEKSGNSSVSVNTTITMDLLTTPNKDDKV